MTNWDLLYYLGRANFDKVKSDYLPGEEAPEKSDNEGMARYEYGRVVKATKEADEKVEIMYEDVSPFKEDGSLPNKVSGHGAEQDHESRPPGKQGAWTRAVDWSSGPGIATTISLPKNMQIS
jgi:hypothetical protein